jgi:putative transposase
MWDQPPPQAAPVQGIEGIKSLNPRLRQAARRRGHFATEQAAMKILYLTVLQRRRNRSNPAGRINGWKSILNTLAITDSDRLNIK